MSEFPEILTSRLRLRQFGEPDLQNVYTGLSNPEVIKYYGVSFRSLEQTKEQIEWFKELEKNKTGIWWAICSAETGEFYGATGYNNLSREHRKAELGFWLLPQFQKKGIVNEAATAILQYAFENLDLHRIEATVETENTASVKALEKLNFSHEGTMRDSEIKNGRFISVAIYAKLNQ